MTGASTCVNGGYDLAVRMGAIEDSELISHKLADITMVIVASPSLAGAATCPGGPPTSPGMPPSSRGPKLVHWKVGGETVRVPWRMSTGNMIVTRDAARAGLGIAFCAEFLALPDLERGSLIPPAP